MDVERIAAGLWRWTARHPEWKPDDEWDAVVASTYYEDPEAVVLVDPLLPGGEDEARFWEALDRDVERLGLPVAVLTTSAWHERSAQEVSARYGALRTPPGGVQPLPTPPEPEVVFWIPSHEALVAGDVLIGAADGLRVEPSSWVEGPYEELLAAVEALGELPVERVLPSHGPAVLSGGQAALRLALAQARSSWDSET